jgi:hypothetical protein
MSTHRSARASRGYRSRRVHARGQFKRDFALLFGMARFRAWVGHPKLSQLA